MFADGARSYWPNAPYPHPNMKKMINKSVMLLALIAFGGITLTSCTSQMSNNNMGTNAAVGAAAGAATGYVYDQYKKSGEGNSRAWDRTTTTRALTGAGVGAAAGALLTPQQQQAQQQQPPQYYQQQQASQYGYR